MIRSSLPEKPTQVKGEPMRTGNSKPLTPELAAELRALEAMPDAEIDTSDIPVVRDWTGAKRGKFYRPAKREITLKLDADLVNFFEARGRVTKPGSTRLCANGLKRIGPSQPTRQIELA